MSSSRDGTWSRFARNRPALAALVVLAALVLAAALAPWLAPFDPNAIDLRPALAFAPPSLAHPFGTDDAGRDWLSRALHGARVSLSVAAVATTLAIGIGTTVGVLAGYFGRALDALLMRLCDALAALPLFLVVLVAQAAWRPGVAHLATILGVTSWMGVARIVRAEVLAVRATEYLQAAEALGASHARRLRVHVLPNVAGSILVAATLAVGAAILTEAGISYLGLGVPLPDPSWGNMLQSGLTRLARAPWLVLFPGALISATVLAVNFVGDGLRDAFDPLMKRDGDA